MCALPGEMRAGPLKGVPSMLVAREGCFMYDDLQARHAAGGTTAYRRLFLLGSDAFPTFLAAASLALGDPYSHWRAIEQRTRRRGST
jgi:hypothetical protein